MESKLRNNYFIIAKFIGIMALIVWAGLKEASFGTNAGEMILTGALFLLCSIVEEIDANKKRHFIWLIGEGLSALIAIALFPVIGIFFVALVYLDIVGEYGYFFYFLTFLLLIPAYFFKLDIGICVLVFSFMLLMYFMHCKIVMWYRKNERENLEMESQLKSDMISSRLRHENEMLEEKSRISQALHDKLGHSINGSLYKLEAVKLLMDKKPEESEKILQEVIDNLRGSMDEIRVIIRNERPDKKKSAVMALQSICSECEEQYKIKTSLEITPEDCVIPEKIWEIILDNTYEAITNSLKYSGCDRIEVSINVLAEVVRVTIKDNGRGCSSVTEGMGIQGMKKRVRSVKGYMDIESEMGFSINMILPIAERIGGQE